MITNLDHVNIDTDDLDATVAFYEGALKLVSGPKPSGNPGMWMFIDDKAVVHINIIEPGAENTAGRLNHIAFDATDLDETTSALEAASVEYEVFQRPDLAITQVRCVDPNGIPVEINIATEF